MSRSSYKLRWSWRKATGALLVKTKKSEIGPWARNHEVKLFGPAITGKALFTAINPSTNDGPGGGVIKATFKHGNGQHGMEGTVPSDGILAPQRHFFPEGFVTGWKDLEERTWHWIIKKEETLLQESLNDDLIRARINGPPWSSFRRTSKLFTGEAGQVNESIALLGTPLGVQLARMWRFTPPKGVAVEILPAELSVPEILSVLILGAVFS